MYVFANSDPEARPNLEHFVREGIAAGDADLAAGAAGGGVDYLILIQHDERLPAAAGRLPDLPPNARFVWHSNECYDWGTFGWLVSMIICRSRFFCAVSQYIPPHSSFLHSIIVTDALFVFSPPPQLQQEPMRAMVGRYHHFLFLNSSVRGPFMPAYLRGVMHWADAFVG